MMMALLSLTQMLDPKSPEAMGWLLICLFTLLGLLGTALFIAVQIKHLRAKPAPHPLIMKLDEEFVKRGEFAELKEDVHNQIKDMRAYVHEGVHSINGGLDRVSQQGSEREERLSDKLERKFTEAITASNSSASKTHMRIDALAQKQGEMVGELKHIAQAVQEAAKAAHSAALAAASKGGRA